MSENFFCELKKVTEDVDLNAEMFECSGVSAYYNRYSDEDVIEIDHNQIQKNYCFFDVCSYSQASNLDIEASINFFSKNEVTLKTRIPYFNKVETTCDAVATVRFENVFYNEDDNCLYGDIYLIDLEIK